MVTVKYLQQNEVFADAFNFFVYHGQKVIDPESLCELDTREIDVPYGGVKGAKQPVQRVRDVVKSLTAMTDRQAAYLILAVESQANIHYAMPVKNLVYDALQYAKQVQEAASSHKRTGDYKNAGSDEYLSGFMKEDHLIPVITLVIYFGAKAWDGPMSVHEMFSLQDANILSFVPDYRINLIAPALIPDEEFKKFSTSLREVLSFIKHANDADKLEALVNSDKGFQRLGRKEVDVLNSCVVANLPLKEKEEVLDVCKAIQVLEQRAAEDARKEEQLAAAKAIKKARNEEQLAAKKARTLSVKKMLNLGKLSFEEIAEISELTVEEVEALAAKESA